ncbi:MAG TPA: hypothetical protein VIN76_14375 [Parasphingorhabdus sp.]
MALGAEASDVAVVVATTFGEGYDMIGHGRFANHTLGSAVAA